MTILKFKWPWNKQESKNIDEEYYEYLKKFQLKNRVKNACQDNTDYELRLRTFCEDNMGNVLLLTNVAGYHSYLVKNGCTEQEAAKETLQMYRH